MKAEFNTKKQLASRQNKKYMKFNLRTLAQRTNWRRVLGIFGCGLLLLWKLNTHFMDGNEEAGKYAQRYIQESDTIIVPLDYHYEYHYGYVTSPIIRDEGGKFRYFTYTFNSNKYKKYMCIYAFEGFNIYRKYLDNGESFLDDAETMDGFNRSHFISYDLYDEELVSFRVNCKQWNDPTYGTKENPMPIFWMKALSDYNPSSRDIAIVSDKVNEKFVECYLKFLLPKEEFKRLYK